jgi:hypothetical protein
MAMSNAERRDRRNYLRRAIKAAERERAEHMARFPADTSGNHDFGKHIGLMAEPGAMSHDAEMTTNQPTAKGPLIRS